MGRATRWLKNIFGLKRSKEQGELGTNSGIRKGRKRSCFGHSRRDSSGGLCHNLATIPANRTAAECAWPHSFCTHSEKDQNEHAIAVAAATAAAADAAVAAAQAAVEVVRLTSHNSVTTLTGGREIWASVKIQTTFRSYLARKALRALKALVKLQALVRGYLVRRQAAATLHGMKALVRAQAIVRSKRARVLINNENSKPQQKLTTRRSTEAFEDNRSENSASIYSRRLSASFEPKTIEMDTGRPKSRSRRPDTSFSECGDYPSYQFPRGCHPGFTGHESSFSTAQSTPRFLNYGGSNPPSTPAKSAYADYFSRQHANYPNYMTTTQSFKAKLRSQSVPKQRSEPGSRKKMSLREMMESRNSLSGVGMQRSCSRAQEAISFRNAVMGKLNA
ncbi:hypothetical protein Nepgr_018357 [Nepenthes gracilis]|uniref:DUF4005 domain-containing protein n=1 Tax=Nepenthes gracilis TaxID=150966 RepID=A0AAD3XU85_NEPGR|nr:hypothetical protein Nepgr_018357 [Nepenthes gracilis]